MIIVGSLTSWYHYLGLISYIQYNKLEIEEIILVRRKFFNKEARYEEDVLYQLANKITFVESEKKLNSYLEGVTTDRALLFSSSFYPYNVARVLAKQKILYEIVTIEEGIGTYGDLKSELSSVYRESKARSNNFYATYYLFRFSFTLAMKKYYFHKIKCHTWFNFDIKTLKNNKAVNESYSNSLKYCCELNDPNLDLDITSEDCLLISSPFCELGYIKEHDYLLALISCLSKYRRIYIKPHPIESTDKYIGSNFYIIDSSIPIEKIAMQIDKEVDIFAFSSTAVYTLSVFANKNVFRLTNLDFFYNKLYLNQKLIISNNSKPYIV